MELQMRSKVLAIKEISDEEFEKIMADHELWLSDSSIGKRADLSDLSLSKHRLAGRNFSQARLSGANFFKADLRATNFSDADLSGADFHAANLRNAVLSGAVFEGASLCGAKLNKCIAQGVSFDSTVMWDCQAKHADFTGARFFFTELCDSDFTGSIFQNATFIGADMDNAIFTKANLKEAYFSYINRSFWSDFSDSDMTGAKVNDTHFDDENLKNVKGLYRPLYCPEEGSFIAWKSCRGGKIVKLLIPEDAERKGYAIGDCRASRAVVLDIFNKDGDSVDEAISQIDKDFIYKKGKTVVAKAVPSNYSDVSGIWFELSRAEAETYDFIEEDDEE